MSGIPQELHAAEASPPRSPCLGVESPPRATPLAVRPPKLFFDLQPHPTDSDAAPSASGASAVTVEIHWLPEPRVLMLHYDLRTPLAPVLPPLTGATPGRHDGLWRATCCELFLAAAQDAEAYYEFNFSPSGDWAAYAFDGRRRGMRAFFWPGGSGAGGVGSAAPDLQRHLSVLASPVTPRDAPMHRLEVLVRLPALPWAGAYRVVPTVVLETAAGRSHWAVRHPAAQPDFHDPAGFGEPRLFFAEPAA